MTMHTLKGDPGRIHEPFPLSDIQYAYWIGRQGLYELGNKPTHLYFELDGALEPERLDRAWDAMIQRHPMLRAEFLSSAEQRIQPRPPGAYRIPVIDLRGVDLAEQEQRIRAVRERMSSSAPALEGWPHFEILLHLLPEGRTRLHFNIDMLIVDAFSVRLLFGDWGRVYADPTAGTPLDITFRDYLLAERDLLAGPAADASRAYWRERAQRLPPPPQLPRRSGSTPGALRDPAFSHRFTEIAAADMALLHDRAQDRGITGGSLLAAAFAETLALWSTEPRFTINATLARRFPLHPQVNDVIGDFTSTVLLGLDSRDGRTFVDRARQCNEQMWRDLDHQHVSGVEVLRQQSQARGQTVMNPIVFTCALTEMRGDLDWAGTLVSHATETSQVTLDNRILKYRGGLLVTWDAVDDAYPPGLLDDMHAHYCELIRRLARDDDAWNAASHRALPAAQQQVRRTVNATDGALPDGLLHDRLVATAARQPAKIAVVDDARTLTYGQLLDETAALSNALVAAGAAPGEPIAVVTRAGCERVIAPVGVLRAGGAYVPVDPDAPAERFRVMFEDAGVRLAVTTVALDAALVWPPGVRRLLVDRLEAAAAHPPRPAARPTDTAYVIYTSGSTGRPKGVALDHRGPVNTIVDITERFGIGPEDRVLALSNLSFDLSVYDIFGVLGAGGTLVYPPADRLRDPSAWVEAVERHGVTLWNTVPLLYSELVDAAAHGGQKLASLRLALLSGDWIPLDLPARSRAQNPSAALVSLGGATEASIWSIHHPIGAIDPTWRSVPYGRPLRSQRFHVLDDRLEPCPDWVEGDLYIAGVGLAQGYFKDEARTRASFFAHPVTGERLYRTGDRGRYRPDGDIEFLGRTDSQVKIRGFRVELGDIESQLREHPEIRDCCVLVYPPPGAGAADASARRSLVGYVLPAGEREATEETLLAFVRGRVPEHMVPTRILFVDAIPKSANGKIDRRAFPDPAASLAGGKPGREPPTGATEEAIARIWSKVLGLPFEALGIHDRFFELGGNSLLLAQLQRMLASAFPRAELRIVQLFEHQTIAALAAVVAGEQPGAQLDLGAIQQRAQRRRRSFQRVIDE